MPVVKRLLCLANSRKLSGRCVAGKETDPNTRLWIRPVSDRPHQEVSEHERQYKDGSDIKVLDVMDVPLIRAQPNTYQSENWLLDPGYYWIHQGRVTWEELFDFRDEPTQLWLNDSSTYNGLNDRVALTDAQSIKNSLFLLYVESLSLRVFAPGEAFGNPKRRVQANFWYKGVNYWLWVTDPLIERKYLAGENGDYSVGECFLTVSLGEPHNGFCYKLVATVITLN
jgi:hypothetical protein